MAMTADEAPRAALMSRPEPDPCPVWSTAQFLDRHLAGGLTLRALVYPTEDGKWEWTVSSLDGPSRGELISTGVEHCAAAARATAASEITKCVEDAILRDTECEVAEAAADRA